MPHTPSDDYFLDITSDVCPITFVKTKLTLEKMEGGQTLSVRLKGEEPLRNVPASVQELGHIVLEILPEDPENASQVFVMRIQKKA